MPRSDGDVIWAFLIVMFILACVVTIRLLA